MSERRCKNLQINKKCLRFRFCQKVLIRCEAVHLPVSISDRLCNARCRGSREPRRGIASPECRGWECEPGADVIFATMTHVILCVLHPSILSHSLDNIIILLLVGCSPVASQSVHRSRFFSAQKWDIYSTLNAGWYWNSCHVRPVQSGDSILLTDSLLTEAELIEKTENSKTARNWDLFFVCQNWSGLVSSENGFWNQNFVCKIGYLMINYVGITHLVYCCMDIRIMDNGWYGDMDANDANLNINDLLI